MWYLKKSSLQLIGFFDTDYAGSKTGRKSTSGTCQFLSHILVSWSSKNQNSITISIAKAEYIAAGSCRAQILWIKQQLSDFGVSMHNIPIFYDNTSAITLPRILFSTYAQSILRLDIISLEIMHLEVTYALNMLILSTNLLIFSPNL